MSLANISPKEPDPTWMSHPKSPKVKSHVLPSFAYAVFSEPRKFSTSFFLFPHCSGTESFWNRRPPLPSNEPQNCILVSIASFWWSIAAQGSTGVKHCTLQLLPRTQTVSKRILEKQLIDDILPCVQIGFMSKIYTWIHPFLLILGAKHTGMAWARRDYGENILQAGTLDHSVNNGAAPSQLLRDRSAGPRLAQWHWNHRGVGRNWDRMHGSTLARQQPTTVAP